MGNANTAGNCSQCGVWSNYLLECNKCRNASLCSTACEDAHVCPGHAEQVQPRKVMTKLRFQDTAPEDSRNFDLNNGETINVECGEILPVSLWDLDDELEIMIPMHEIAPELFTFPFYVIKDLYELKSLISWMRFGDRDPEEVAAVLSRTIAGKLGDIENIEGVEWDNLQTDATLYTVYHWSTGDIQAKSIRAFMPPSGVEFGRGGQPESDYFFFKFPKYEDPPAQ